MNDIFYKFLWQTKTERKIEVPIETDGYGTSEYYSSDENSISSKTDLEISHTYGAGRVFG